jgi:hypothetical protein
MLAARIYAQTWEVDARLVPFNITRAELIEVVRAVVAARADAVENDPATAEGLFAYIFGTRNVRSLFRTKGWLLRRQNNVETVKHPERDQWIVYQSVDLAAALMHDPQPISGKGSATDRFVAAGQGSLFTAEQLAAGAAVSLGPVDTGMWFFCVSVNEDDVRAELSLPAAIEDGNFKDFIERIFIVRDGEWPELAARHDDEEGGANEFEPVISRK